MLPNFVKMHSVKHNETAFTILPSFAHGQTERDMDRLGRWSWLVRLFRYETGQKIKRNYTAVAQPGISTPLVSKPAIGHEPEPVQSTSQPPYLRSILLTLQQHNTTSTPLVPKPATGHEPEPVKSTSHPYNLPP
jgi:hypothetical protein